jgi:hypothetical protein
MAATYRQSINATATTDVLTSVVPTLFIGLGGTGKDVIMRFRRRLYEEYRPDATARYSSLPFAKMIVFDTNMRANSDIPSGDNDEPENYQHVRLSRTDGEWISVQISHDEYQLAKADLNTRKDRRLTPWMSSTFFDLVPEKAVEDGSGAIRQAGRLAFFVHYRKIRKTIEDALESMLAYMMDQGQQQQFPDLQVYPNQIEVVIVTSIAGGTGAGMFLDMAYLIRDIFSTHPKFARLSAFDPAGITPHVSLIATLPTVYSIKDESKKTAHYMNAYASLLEIENYNTARLEDNFFATDENGKKVIKSQPLQFRVNWDDPAGPEKMIDGAPWHSCYLIDNVNDKIRGAKRGMHDVHQMIADYLYLDLGENAFSLHKRSVRSNHATLFTNTVDAEVHDPAAHLEEDSGGVRRSDQILYTNKYGCSYSSFGLAEIYIDRERIKRAASYRLASNLISKSWIGRIDEYGAGRYSEWSNEDLYGESVVGDEAARGDDTLTFSPKTLAMSLLKEDGQDWLGHIRQLFDNLKNLDLAQTPIEELDPKLRKVLTSLRNSIDGKGTASGEQRTIDQTLRQRSLVLQGTGGDIGPMRRRLDRRSRARFSAVGAIPTVRLLEDYEKMLTQSRQEAANWAKESVSSIDSLLARLADAIQVPAVLRGTAVRIEFERAVEQSLREVMRWCRNAAARHLDAVYLNSLVYVRDGESDVESLRRRYTAWREMLQATDDKKKSISGELVKKFDTYRKQQDSDRRIALVPVNTQTNELWKGEQYDAESNAKLKDHPEIGAEPDRPGSFDLTRFESLVLRGLSRKNRCEAVEQIFRKIKSDPDSLNTLVDTLATACTGPLGNQYAMHHFANGNIAEYLIGREQRTNLLRRLVDNSGPYIPSIGTARRRGWVPIWKALLGASAGEAGDDAVVRVATEIKGLAADNSNDPPRDLINEKYSYDRSRLILHREVGGIPAHFYSWLPELRKAYESSPDKERLTCHLRHRESAENLPDLDIISDEEYKVIADQVEEVVRGILLRFIECEDETMIVRVSIPEAFTRRKYFLGTRLSRIVKNACQHAEVSRYLQKQWVLWRKQGQAHHLAVFYNAIQQNLKLFPSEVPAEANAIAIPPLYNCLRKLLRTIEGELRAAPEGPKYFELLRPRNDNERGYVEWEQEFNQLCEHVRKTCLVSACASLPILQIDQDKIQEVKFFEGEPPSQKTPAASV